jgi:predicted phosphodiesterase
VEIEGKRVLVISDLHLGDGTGSDDFQYKTFRRLKDAEKNLIEWIRNLDVDLLILAGDTEELWQHNQKVIKRVYKEFFSFLKTQTYIRIDGNHDITAFGRDSLIIKYKSMRYFIAHGHQGNPIMLHPLAKIGVRLLAFIEKIIPSIDMMMQLAFKTEVKAEILTDTFADTIKSKYDFVILGHSHRLKSKDNYYNTGTCQHGSFEGVLIVDGVPSCVKETY